MGKLTRLGLGRLQLQACTIVVQDKHVWIIMLILALCKLCVVWENPCVYYTKAHSQLCFARQDGSRRYFSMWFVWKRSKNDITQRTILYSRMVMGPELTVLYTFNWEPDRKRLVQEPSSELSVWTSKGYCSCSTLIWLSLPLHPPIAPWLLIPI
jgi:hypothetical protein